MKRAATGSGSSPTPIWAQISNKMSSTSPHLADDFFRTFFGILLKMMKCRDIAKHYIPAPDQFRFKLVSLSRHEPVNLAVVDDRFGHVAAMI
jgi:hypothetical protein